jgi:anaphase-promoting complex subunit 2
VASLVVDSESGDSLVDDDGPIQPLQSPQVDDYTDPNWEPEPIDAGPGWGSHHFCQGGRG